jgi:RNA polymerase sigma-70 factor (ECF subfamily)
LLRGIVGRERFGHRSSFRSFLLGVARRVALERYRTQQRTVNYLPSPEVAANEPLHDDALHRRRMIAALQVCVPDLPAKLQQALHMYYWESLTSREIAKRVGISENTVRSRLRRGRERLRDHLDAQHVATRHSA